MSFIFLLSILYLLVPAAVANMIPVFVRKINFLDYPVDFGSKIFGKRVFGGNKTFRGLVFGIIGSIIFVFIQDFLYKYEFFAKTSLVNYNEVNIFVFGFLVGFGVLFGDLVGSFIKRRLNFKPGESFYVLDQINGGLGFGLFLLIYFAITDNLSLDLYSYLFVLLIILIWLIGHLILKYVGYLLRINKEKI